MRLLVHGMQSSGATAFTLFLAQRPDCLALVDVQNNFAAPRVETSMDMVVKVVVTTAYSLTEHKERFKPDRTILFLRDPRDNYMSLRTKNYRNYSGLMDEKFVLLDELFAARQSFDAVIHYEDFVRREPSVLQCINQMGWPVTEEFFTYRRRHEELLRDLWEQLPDLMTEMEMVFGNTRGREVDDRFLNRPWPSEMEERLASLCPRILDYYRELRRPSGGGEG